MSKQPRALELARNLEELAARAPVQGKADDEDLEAAALLRSQHELIGELVEALGDLECKAKLGADMSSTPGVAGGFRVLADFARAALSKAKEQQ